MVFKHNNDDMRESIAHKLLKILTCECAEFYCSDFQINDEPFYSLKEVLDKCYLFFSGYAHQKNENLKFRKNHKIVDCWGLFNGDSVF